MGSEVTAKEIREFAEACGWTWWTIDGLSFLLPRYAGEESLRSTLGWRKGRHGKEAAIEEYYPETYGHFALPDFTRDLNACFETVAYLCKDNPLLKGKLAAAFFGWDRIEDACANAIRAVIAAAKARRP